MDGVIEKEVIEGIARVVWCPNRQAELAVERCVAFIKSGREDCLRCPYQIKAQYASLRIRDRIKPQARDQDQYYYRRKVFKDPPPPPAPRGRPRKTEAGSQKVNPPLANISEGQED